MHDVWIESKNKYSKLIGKKASSFAEKNFIIFEKYIQ